MIFYLNTFTKNGFICYLLNFLLSKEFFELFKILLQCFQKLEIHTSISLKFVARLNEVRNCNNN